MQNTEHKKESKLQNITETFHKSKKSRKQIPNCKTQQKHNMKNLKHNIESKLQNITEKQNIKRKIESKLHNIAET